MQVIPVTCTLEKSFLQPVLLKVCELFLFRQSKETRIYIGLYECLLYVSRENRTKQILRIKLSFLHVYIQFDLPKCEIILKNLKCCLKWSLKCWLFFHLFLRWSQKITFLLQIWSSFKLSFLRNNLYNKVKLLI